MTYAFKSKEVTEALVLVGNAAMGRKPEGPEILGTEIITVKTPAAGIEAREGVDCSSAACTLVYLNKSDELVESTDHTNVTVYNTTEEDIAGDQYIAATRQRGVWVASVSGGGGDPPKGVQFRLKSGWNGGTGVSTAVALTPMGGVAAGSELTVYDFKKLFQNAVGSEEQEESTGGSIGWATKVGSIWIVNQCTQKINRYEATIANGLCTGLWGESLSVTNPIAQSVWPYIDSDPALSGTNELDVINLHGLPANGGKVWIEFQQIPTATQDPDNTEVPYSEGINSTDGRWVITDVEKPVANYLQCVYKAGSNSWEFIESDPSGSAGGDPGFEVYDGFEPDTEFGLSINTPEHLNMLGETAGSPCLEDNTMGLARLDRKESGAGNLSYFVCMTSSSLNGEAHEAAVAGTLSPSNESPPNDEDIIIVDGCDVQYKRIGKTWLFGSKNATGSCELDEQTVSEPFIDWEDQVIVEDIFNDDGVLKMKLQEIKVCSKEELDDKSLPSRTVDIVEDVYCSGGSLVKDYKTIRYVGNEVASSNAVEIDTSCIEFDYTQIIYPEYPYIDYYDIIWPADCNPCDVPSGCCVITAADGSTEQYSGTTAEWCELQYENRDDVREWNWNVGDCEGCCTMFFLNRSGATYDITSQSECESRNESGYVDPATGYIIDNAYWNEECTPKGCCDGGSKNGYFIGQSECVNAGGNWTDGPCPTGCCVAPGTDVHNKVVTELRCDQSNGTWNQGQNCQGDSFGCCVIYDQQGRVLDQQSNLVMSDCEQLFLNTTGAYSKTLENNPTCPNRLGCCDGGTFDGQQVYEGQCVGGGGSFTLGAVCENDGGDCENVFIESFFLSASGGACNATFSQDDEAEFLNGVAAVDGVWILDTGGSQTQNISGTVVVTKSGNTYNVSTTLNQASITLSGTGPAGVNCDSGSSGQLTGYSSTGTACEGSWNGAFTFSTTT